MYEEYAVLDSQIKKLTAQKDALKVNIIEDIVKDNATGADTPVGKFTLAKVKTWTYTPKVTELEEQFKAQKATEQSTGEATFEEKPSLRFTQLSI